MSNEALVTKALKLALGVLRPPYCDAPLEDVIKAVEEALASQTCEMDEMCLQCPDAQPKQEQGDPVAWMLAGSMIVREDWIERLHWPFEYVGTGRAIPDSWTPMLYTTPNVPEGRQQRPSLRDIKPLTDEQVSDQQCRRLLYGFMLDFNAVGFEQAGRNLHRSMKEAVHGIKE